MTVLKNTLIASSFAALLLGGDYVLAHNPIKAASQANSEQMMTSSGHHMRNNNHGMENQSQMHQGMMGNTTPDFKTLETELQLTSEQLDLLKQVQSSHQTVQASMTEAMHTMHSNQDHSAMDTKHSNQDHSAMDTKHNNQDHSAMDTKHSNQDHSAMDEQMKSYHQAHRAMMTSHQTLVIKFEQSLTDTQRQQWQAKSGHSSRGCYAR